MILLGKSRTKLFYSVLRIGTQKDDNWVKLGVVELVDGTWSDIQ